MFTATGKLVEIRKPTCPVCKSENIKGKRLSLSELLPEMAEQGYFELLDIFYLFSCNDCKISWVQVGSLWWDEYYLRSGFEFEKMKLPKEEIRK